ncbi:glycosyltransferase family 2 protein, partial [Candidatus Omnitrophota bacterium]
FRGLVLIRNNENLGFVKAVNQGIAVSGENYILVLNNDTILTEGWLAEMVDVMERDARLGLLNPSSNTSGQFPKDLSIDDYAKTLTGYKGQAQELYNARGFCMLVRREVIDKLGPFDEIYHMGYFDDTDYCKRAQGLGYRTARAKAAYVYHRENKSFALREDNSELFRKNEEIFFSRWGRHLRIGYFIRDCRDDSIRRKVDELATDVARSGHQISIFLKKNAAWPVRLDHFDIRKNELNGGMFTLVSIYKILSRRKKKMLHALVTEDALLGSLLEKLKFAHKARVFVKPNVGSVLEFLKIRSKTRG